MSAEHWVIARTNEPIGCGYWLSIREQTGRWRTVQGESGLNTWLAEAIAAARETGFSNDLTVSARATADVLRDPDSVALQQRLTLVCRESAKTPGRWSMLTMNDAGEFRLSRTVVSAAGVDAILKDYLASRGSDEREVLQVRPQWHARDFVAQLA